MRSHAAAVAHLRLRESGMDDYVAKPVEPAALEQVLRRFGVLPRA